MKKIKTKKGILICLFAVGSISLTFAAQDSLKTPPAVSGRKIASGDLLPADVLARVKLLQKELELIRLHLGKPKNQHSPINVSNATPREVYFQAKTLFQKANRLSFEIARTRSKEPLIATTTEITPSHVWSVVDSALKQVLTVKEKIQIRKYPQEIPFPESSKPTDVYRSIVDANRQLNSLLEKRFSSRDVYQQITYAVHYAARLLSRFPGAKRIPEPSPFKKNKTPDDVFQRLARCFEIIKDIAEYSQVKTLGLEIDQDYPIDKKPSDVYDMASLIVSELTFFYSQCQNLEAPSPSYPPGRKTPSDGFQRAGLLKIQLETLKKFVSQNPGWLKE